MSRAGKLTGINGETEKFLTLSVSSVGCLRRPVRLVAIIAPSEVQPMMCEIFREIFRLWQVGFIGGRHEFQINRVAGGLETTLYRR